MIREKLRALLDAVCLAYLAARGWTPSEQRALPGPPENTAPVAGVDPPRGRRRMLEGLENASQDHRRR